MTADSFDKGRVPERAQRAKTYLEAEYNLEGQHKWYDDKAISNKLWHMRLGLVIVAAGAAISVIQIWAPTLPENPVHWSSWLTAVLGSVVVVTKGIDRLWSFDENWAEYRQAAEAIKRERRFYVNAAGPYAGIAAEDAAHRLFIERVEDVIATEQNIFWQQNRNHSEGEKKG